MTFRSQSRSTRRIASGAVLAACLYLAATAHGASGQAPAGATLPLPLDSYPALEDASLFELLAARVRVEPFNLVGTLIFAGAIIHTFLAPMFLRAAHRLDHRHRRRLAELGRLPQEGRGEVSFAAELCHFLGEVEAIFGIWVVPLLVAIAASKGWNTARDYLSQVNFTEPMFVMVIMAIAASRPILAFSERVMSLVAGLGGRSLPAWWVSIMTIGPVLGSFITEPAAMTISALLLAEKLYRYEPSPRLAYGTLGLLFVNVSVGGTLTHFAAPPVLMVAGTWDWGLAHMATHFGWKAVLGILIANVLYFAFFARELRSLGTRLPRPEDSESEPQVSSAPVPAWVTTVHLLFLAWTVVNNHYPVLFLGGFLFYLAFTRATEHHQSELALRPALLVGFFLAGLVVHGKLQGWWIAPVLARLDAGPLFFGALGLTAFNDNAAITYLASLVPGFSDQLKYAVVAGAVAGGGLTVIANAPNPAGQSILGKFFPDGVSPLRLLLGAGIPTVVVSAVFLLFR